MFYPKNKETELSLELFKNPTSEYRGTPFWAWNCELCKDELLRQIDIFREMGLGGFHMHVRTGMATEYLSDEFMDFIKACVGKAKDNGMLAYLYDEDRFPSGAAGGLVTKDDRFRQRMLRITTVPYADKTSDDAAPKRTPNNRTEEGTLIACFDIVLDKDGYLASYKQIDKDATPKGTKWYTYLDISPKLSWFNNQSYIDTLNKDAMDKFIEVTYEAYKKHCGDDFGKTIPSIFTDEPQFSSKKRFAYPFDTADVTLPWTDDLPKSFKEVYGEDLIAGIPELFWNLPDGKISTIRYHYHDHLTERFAVAFADNCGRWCRENGIMLTGHMLHEHSLYAQTGSIGETMRHYRGFDMPGIDILMGHREFLTAKQAQSAVHQYGREAMLSELYGCTGWDFDFRGHKIHGDWQAALGVTVRVQHLAWVSMKGSAKRDYPASISYQSPWYKEYSRIEDHFARVNTAMTRGKPVAKVGVIHPIESFWMYWGVSSQTDDILGEKNNNFLNLTDWLIKRTVDFDFISESILPELCEKGSAPLNVGKMKYDTIIVPDCETLRSTTLDRLEKFQKAGGKLIFMGNAPKYVDALPSNRGKKLYNKSMVVGFTCESIMQALREDKILEIRHTNGTISNRYCHQFREDGDGLWLFVAQAIEPTNKYICHSDRIKISVKGEYIPTLYNTQTGETEKLDCYYQNGCTVFNYIMYEHDSLLIRYEKGKQTEKIVGKGVAKYTEIPVPYEVEYELSEPNVVLLDMAEYALDDEEYRSEEEILRLDNVVRQQINIPSRNSHTAQPWVLPKDIPSHKLSLRFTILSEIKLPTVQLALEEPENAEIIWNGKKVDNTSVGYYVDKDIKTVNLPGLKKGNNILELTIPLGIATNTEWCYILGDFGVKVAGRKKVIIEKPKTLCFGDITTQGFPFYGANITYKIPIETEGGQAQIATEHYAGGLITVDLQEQNKGIIYSPYTADLTLPKGKATLNLTLYGNRFNAFGHIHNANGNYWWSEPGFWRSQNSSWCYEYILRPMGITATPKLKIQNNN